MTDTEKTTARGRPARPDEDIRAQIISAATKLLLQNGYAATTMQAVASEAGIAKKTLYRFASNREELVSEIIRSWTDSYSTLALSDISSSGEVGERLQEILQLIATRALSAEAIGMFRLLISDMPAREKLLDIYNRHGIEHGKAQLSHWLQRQYEKGFITREMPAQTSDLLLSMTIAEPLRRIALGLEQPLPDNAIDQRIILAVSWFSELYVNRQQ